MNKAMSLVMNMLHFLVLFCLCHTVNFCSLPLLEFLHSVLWRCWLGGRKGIWPVKTDWWGTGMAICLEQGADLHMAQLMPLPLTVSCFSKIQIGFTFLVPAHPGSPGQRAVMWSKVYATVTHLSIRPSVPSCGPSSQEISIDCCRGWRSAAATLLVLYILIVLCTCTLVV